MSQDIYEELEKKFKELPVFHKIYPLPKEDLSLFTTIKEVIPIFKTMQFNKWR